MRTPSLKFKEKFILDCDREICTCNIWRRVHRPEDYVADVTKVVAAEIKVPYAMFIPLLPIARTMLRRWEDAGVEHTEYTEYTDGSRVLRTIFLLNNFSDRAIYALVEKLLKSMGVGRTARLEEKGVDFTWHLLGGVLSDYAGKAGVSRKSTEALLEFRLRNSDYRTVTTWYESSVEIANLKTGRVETLELPPRDVKRIIDWGLDFHKKECGRKYARTREQPAECAEYQALLDRYKQVTQTAGKA